MSRHKCFATASLRSDRSARVVICCSNYDYRFFSLTLDYRYRTVLLLYRFP